MIKLRNKKLLLILVGLLVVAMAIAGCSSKKAEKDVPGGPVADDSEPMNTVTVTIECKTLETVDKDLMDSVSDNGVMLSDTEIEIAEDKTVIDLLTEMGIDFLLSGNLIDSINGLATGDGGEMSGWLFTINGEFPTESADQVVVNDGDKIAFLFTCDWGEDVGLSFG